MSNTTIVLFTALSIGSALSSSAVALLSDRLPRLINYAILPLLSLAGMAGVIAGLGALQTGIDLQFTLPFGLPWLPWHIHIDALAGLFLTLIGLLTTAASLYARGYLQEYLSGSDSLIPLGVFSGLFVTGMLLVVIADDAFLFMIAWELMSLSSYFLVTWQHENSANRRAGFIYLLMAHVGALAILLGYGVLAGFGGGFEFALMRDAELSPLWASVAFGLAFFGFGMKAGLVPIHVWLPEAHPVAPSHISALMSGVMLKVAVYGFIRVVFDLLGNPQCSWGVVVLLVGGISALYGVLAALMQHDLKRLLAYHSVENIGIIFIGLGLSLLFAGTHHPLLAALGLVAALFHTLNHAVFKGLLFLGAGAILHSSHQRDMESMGGLLRRMPWTGFFFLIGCISIAALPPFNGFVSEWLTFQTALQAWMLDNGILRSLVPITAAMLALTGALAAACFVKVYGVVFLGQARSRPARRAREVSLSMRISQGGLAALCLLLGIFPTSIVNLLNQIPTELLGQGLTHYAEHSWLWLTPVEAEAASYAAPLLLVGMLLLWAGMAWWLRRGEMRQVRRSDPWDCGFATPNARMQYTASAFAQPIRHVYGLLFDIKEDVKTLPDGSRRHHLQVDDRFWNLLYLPITRIVLSSARRVSQLQTGQIRHYLGWMLATLVVLLWLIM